MTSTQGGQGTTTVTRGLTDARAWARTGTELLLDAVAGLDEKDFAAPSVLPGWTRKHLVAHAAANADALGNLVHWAATGERTPMYASAQERAEGIAKGPMLSAGELRAWLTDSARKLTAGLDALSDEQWRSEVVTAQGRTVPATEIPWLRAREVCVHAVDLGTGVVTFADLPKGFLVALVAEIRDRRALPELPDGPLPEVAAWLAGRPHTLTDAPELGPWL
ncbi:maleylpyruvate isomerase N-terminal domain-containing protein [Streptomyces sp. GXMU-J15]|uniref:Maleylpyruvate isomerase N-terminal domain-containing protein n=1 Tax=Streptomyces fuscus TaxID=3048495 RepID=A0ABT7J0A8_9ACTN|nr:MULTISPECIES: maleylpyruvate isomerase N-terminal domain-containing protein [Streptomyces]MDL2078245.1 maleylpyruvate isomerase N-terminal domain-containing protein [Streptomyces fuscus]